MRVLSVAPTDRFVLYNSIHLHCNHPHSPKEIAQRGSRRPYFPLAFQNALYSKKGVLTGHKTLNKRIPLVLQANFSQMISYFVNKLTAGTKSTNLGSV